LFRLPNLTHLIVTSPETVGNLYSNKNDVLTNIKEREQKKLMSKKNILYR